MEVWSVGLVQTKLQPDKAGLSAYVNLAMPIRTKALPTLITLEVPLLRVDSVYVCVEICPTRRPCSTSLA